MNSVSPLSPSEIMENKCSSLPEFVIKAVNNLLKKSYNGRDAVIIQVDIIDEIRRLDPSVTREQIFKNRWLDFEPAFESVGWEIEYDKPGYNESYLANFTFRKKKD